MNKDERDKLKARFPMLAQNFHTLRLTIPIAVLRDFLADSERAERYKAEFDKIIEELEGIQADWLGHAHGEVLSGNCVKEAHYKGTATGVRIAISRIQYALLDEATKPAQTPDGASIGA